MSDTTSEPFDRLKYLRQAVDWMNDTQGNLQEEDEYSCKLCKNRGYTISLEYCEALKDWYRVSHPCVCANTRASIGRMKASGLKNIISDYAFDKFQATSDWQKSLKQKAMDYAEDPHGWFFVGGQPGSGKTHICTAICRELLLQGKTVRYMCWRNEIVKLKACLTDIQAYEQLIEPFQNAPVLYIDDFFKTGKGAGTAAQRPTSADINAAFEIVNYRYNNPDMLTIFSSELTEDELMDIDEAIGSRIYERAQAVTIARDRSRNYRLRKR